MTTPTPAHNNTSSSGGRVRRALAALGRCLSAFGAMHLALPPDTPPPAGPGGGGGLPPAHPERLCAQEPLSEQELGLARQLWPASYPQRRRSGR